MNYYDVLRVNKTASTEEIKSSYKKLIKRYHPDLYPGNKTKAEHITRDLNEAYDILSDPEKRAIYDLSLQEPIINYYQSENNYVDTQYQNYNQNLTNQQSQEYNFEENLRKNIHNFVDNQSKKMSPNTKYKIVLCVIFLVFIILLLTTKDYIDFQKSKIEMQKEKELTEEYN